MGLITCYGSNVWDMLFNCGMERGGDLERSSGLLYKCVDWIGGGFTSGRVDMGV